MKNQTSFLNVLLLSCFLLFFAFPTPTTCCGGFFCSLRQPVEQSGEQILFSKKGPTITMHVYIAYTGPAESFSWVLPVPNTPKLGVGSNELFRRLKRNTDPRWTLQWDNSGCVPDFQCPYAFGGMNGGGTGSQATSGGVDVIAVGEVGPFDFKIITGGSGAQVQTWLQDNGYDQPAATADLLDHYTQMNSVFVALKLQKDKAVGEIRPLIMEYSIPDSDVVPCVPLRLTSLAATTDMPITVWILGDHRAVPISFFHVTLSELAYPWLRCADMEVVDGNGQVQQLQQSQGITTASPGFVPPTSFFGPSDTCVTLYNQMLARAVDSVEGHGFVTELAEPTSKFSKAVYDSSQPMVNEADLRSKHNPGQYLQALLRYVSQAGMNQFDPLIQSIIRQHIPMVNNIPDSDPCSSEQYFYRVFVLENGGCSEFHPSGWTFDPAAMTDDFVARIVKPLEDGQNLINSHAKLTRMACILDPDQMTIDPVFAFNSELADVPQEHVATAKGTCATNVDDLQNNNAGDNEGEEFFTSVELTLPDGTVQHFTNFTIRNSCGPDFSTVGPAQENPVKEVKVLETSGSGSIVSDLSTQNMQATAAALMPVVTTHAEPDPSNNQIVDQNQGGGGISPTPTVVGGSVRAVTPCPIVAAFCALSLMLLNLLPC
eukprot:TRINITY_DN68015_c0_g1_i8.p1 TRINITY_DN68015_c0_g1~~TRINITY_DN68015_c0_g1_i8.p1  ORF type:complete len:656 (-),score=82.29 TRINITY_DN68015_c0_g1_i8:74-2041(-)